MARVLGERFEIEEAVKVSSRERTEAEGRLAKVDRKILDTKEAKALKLADFKQQLKDLNEEQKVLLDVHENGVQKVKVQVFERLNDRQSHVEMVRVDNGKVIGERALTAEERQLDIMDLDPKGTGKPQASKPPAKVKGKASAGGAKPGAAKAKGRGKGRSAEASAE
jgi:TolA-binding protein